MESTLRVYVNFLADQFRIRIPYVQNGNQGADALLHGSDPLWNHLKSDAFTQAAREALNESSEFYALYSDYSANRPQISFEAYIDNTLLDFGLKLLRRTPALSARRQVIPLVTDFIYFLHNKWIEAIQFSPLFNLAMDSSDIQLDQDTRISHLDAETRARVHQYFTENSIVFSTVMLENLQLGIFRNFIIPIQRRDIAPPSDNIGSDAELILRILKPDRVINCGLSSYWTIRWHLNEHGGSALSSQFPWTRPLFQLNARETAILPGLWNEIRDSINIKKLQQNRYFQTARRRFVKATENQAMDDRLLDLFIALEALLLRSTETWKISEKVKKRFSVLMYPLDIERRSNLASQCGLAYKQRHVVAHGIERELVGFDGTTSAFNELVQTVDSWLGHTMRGMILLIRQLGSRDTVLTHLDKAASNLELAQMVAQITDTA